MNKVILKGRLTAAPEQRFINENMSTTRFSIAIDRKQKGEKVTDFINVISWNKQGEFIKKYFTKGQEILLIGRLETSQYVDKETQKKITRYEVVAEEVEFVGSKKDKEEIDFTSDNVENTEFEDLQLPF